MEKKIITVSGHSFEMVLTSEDDCYFGVSRTYDLYFKGILIAKEVPSIKSCYNKAYGYTQNLR